MFTYWFLCVFKRLLDGRNLTVPILVDLFFCKLLFDRHSNPRKKQNQDYIQHKHTKYIHVHMCNSVLNVWMLKNQTYLTSTFSLDTPYLLNSVEMYSVFLIHGTTLACCWDLNHLKNNVYLKKKSMNKYKNHKAIFLLALPFGAGRSLDVLLQQFLISRVQKDWKFVHIGWVHASDGDSNVSISISKAKLEKQHVVWASN